MQRLTLDMRFSAKPLPHRSILTTMTTLWMPSTRWPTRRCSSIWQHVLVSSMGAALKMDPTRISVAEFWKVEGCPLARALRKRFKKEGTIPKKKFQCVYSNELLENQPTAATDDSGNGSLVHITGIFGFTLAGLIVKHIHTSVKTTICAPSNRFSPEG